MRFSYAFLSFCICAAGVSLAAEKPANTLHKKAASREVSDESGHSAASETVAAIEALGEKPTNRQVSNVVFAAVRKSPENVLPVVHAAVRVSPQSAAPAIVTAATAAVPDPWKSVSYHRIQALHEKKDTRDFKGGPDGKHSVDPDGPSLTLAEAIARTAFDAQPGLSLSDLRSAVDVALNTDPATLLRYVQSSRSVSGVGDAGSSNFANEPLRPRTLGGNPAVPAPNPPVVSR